MKVEEYYTFYKQVLIQKEIFKYVFPEPLKNGIELYLIYLHKDIDLIRYIKKHKDVSEKGLVTKLIVEFQHYGLDDTQYCEIIKSYRGK